MELDSAIQAARIRLDNATAAWHVIHKKSKDRRPANADEIHQEFKEARRAFRVLVKDVKTKEVKQEVLDGLNLAETSGGISIPPGLSTSQNPIDIDSIDEAKGQTKDTPKTTNPLALIVSSAISNAPLTPANITITQSATITSPQADNITIPTDDITQKPTAAENQLVEGAANQVEVTRALGAASVGNQAVTGAANQVEVTCAPVVNQAVTGAANQVEVTRALGAAPVVNQAVRGAAIQVEVTRALGAAPVEPESATDSANQSVALAPERHTIDDDDIDPVLKALSPPSDLAKMTTPRLLGDAVSGTADAILVGDRKVESSVNANFVGRVTMFPIPQKLQMELDKCMAESSRLLQMIHAQEAELCSPAQRTMQEIRSKLRDVDAGYAAIQAVEKRVAEIQNIIAEGERSFSSNERRKTLLKRKEVLDRLRDEGKSEILNLTMEELPEYQRKRNLLMAEIDAVKLELQNLTTSKSNKTKKGTSIRSKFAKASRDARSTKGERRDSEEEESGSDSESEDEEDARQVDGKRKSTRSNPTIGRKRTKAQRLMLEVVYGDELEEETEANRAGLRDFKVDEWDFEEDMKEEANWAAMTPIERIEYCDNIIKSIRRFEKTGNLQDFRPKYRRSLRHVQSLLPEKCFESRRVAVAIHMTSHGNLICRFHKRHPKHKFFDNGPGLYRVQGVPKQPVYRYRVEEAVTPLRERGYMSCGCLIDDVLLEFYFWKTLKISSPISSLQGVEEPMKGDVIEPRHRAFLIKVFKDHSLLTADDIYDPNRPRDISQHEREVRLLDTSISRLAKLWLEKTGIQMNIVFPHRESEMERMRLDEANASAKQDGDSGLMTE